MPNAMPLCVYVLLRNYVWHTQLSKNSVGSVPSPRCAVSGPHGSRGHVPLNRATENGKFTVSEEILNFLVMGALLLLKDQSVIRIVYILKEYYIYCTRKK